MTYLCMMQTINAVRPFGRHIMDNSKTKDEQKKEPVSSVIYLRVATAAQITSKDK